MIIRTALGDYYTHALEPTLFSPKSSNITARSCNRNVVKHNGQQLKKRKTKSVEIGRSAGPQLSVSPIPPLVGDAGLSDVSNCVLDSMLELMRQNMMLVSLVWRRTGRVQVQHGDAAVD